LGVFSLAHAVFAIIHFTGYVRNNWFLDLYSHVIALPAIVILLSVTVATLNMKHWSQSVISLLADSKIGALMNRAQVLMEGHRRLDVHELSQLKAELFERETELKNDLIPVVRGRIEAGQQLEKMINGIPDPELRREIRREFDALTSRLQAPTPI